VLLKKALKRMQKVRDIKAFEKFIGTSSSLPKKTRGLPKQFP
jgi:hypothetical protein